MKTSALKLCIWAILMITGILFLALITKGVICLVAAISAAINISQAIIWTFLAGIFFIYVYLTM